MNIRIETIVGESLIRYLSDLATLRIVVFREWPYLYDGSREYEEQYLRCYLNDQAMVAIAFHGAQVVGASTAMPLCSHSELTSPDFALLNVPPQSVYYFGESVLLAPYRGQGVGHRFFDEREAYGLNLGFDWAAFCAVERPVDHPMRPSNYVPHDAFWGKRGYQRHPELVTHFGWKDVGDDQETSKPMVFWLKKLR